MTKEKIQSNKQNSKKHVSIDETREPKSNWMS